MPLDELVVHSRPAPARWDAAAAISCRSVEHSLNEREQLLELRAVRVPRKQLRRPAERLMEVSTNVAEPWSTVVALNVGSAVASKRSAFGVPHAAIPVKVIEFFCEGSLRLPGAR